MLAAMLAVIIDVIIVMVDAVDAMVVITKSVIFAKPAVSPDLANPGQSRNVPAPQDIGIRRATYLKAPRSATLRPNIW